MSPIANSSRPTGRRAAAAAAVLGALLCAGCQTIDTYVPTWRTLGVYKIDVNQGNYLAQDQVVRLKVGQTRAQVRQLLGTPLLVSAFRDNRWDYVYELAQHGRNVEHRTLTVYFVDDKLDRWEGDEMPVSVAELNKASQIQITGDGAPDTRPWLDRIKDVFRR